MRKALRTYTKDFIALILLTVIGLATLFVILSQQASALPPWFPFLGENRFELKTELQTAQAVTPGQGQTVDLSGVKVGDVTSVDLVDGVAVVTMQVENEYAPLIHTDASVLLRPRTGLQDMVIEVDPGSDDAPTVPEGFTVPLANSQPNVNFDQILASLDGDTRAYLRLLLAGGAEALGTEKKSNEFASVLRRLEPTTRDIAKINGKLAQRRENLKRVITNFKLIAEELGRSDTDLAEFVSSQNAVFSAFAEEEQNIRLTLQGLPGALKETRGALDASASLSQKLTPALTDLIPSAKALAPALRDTRPFLRQTEPVIREQLRPFTTQVSGVVGDLKRAAGPLEVSSGALAGGVSELNQLVNALAYNPDGPPEGYLFYLSWLNHNTNGLFLTQDGLGPLRRGLFMYTCFTSQLADNAVGISGDLTPSQRPDLKTAREITRLPQTNEICPAGGGFGLGDEPTDATAEEDAAPDDTTTDGATGTAETPEFDIGTVTP